LEKGDIVIDSSVRKVVPWTYNEAMDYLDGKRRFSSCKEEAKLMNSSFARFFS